jgi:hypothetical protein
VGYPENEQGVLPLEAIEKYYTLLIDMQFKFHEEIYIIQKNHDAFFEAKSST